MAEARQSKQSPAEILAWSVIDFNLPALQAYAASLNSGATMATTPTTTTTTTTANPLQTIINGLVAQMPEAMRPYGPLIIYGGGAAVLLMVLSSASGRR